MHELPLHAFERSERPPPLHPDEIHLWLYPAPTVPAQACLRALLGAYLNRAAADVELVRDAHGKPRLGAEAADLHFNLSHTEGCHAIALAALPVGVDVERLRPRARPVAALAQRYFTAAEARVLAGLPDAAAQAAFVGLWSAKEAVVKAIGRGIAFGLHRLAFGLDEAGRVRGLEQIDPAGGVPALWHLARFAPAPDLKGTLAWYGVDRQLRTFLGS